MYDLQAYINHEREIEREREGDSEGWDRFHDQRIKELLNDITELSTLDYEAIGELVVDQWMIKGNYIDVIDPLKSYFEELAEKQVLQEWSEK
jgi:hypothetical protein